VTVIDGDVTGVGEDSPRRRLLTFQAAHKQGAGELARMFGAHERPGDDAGVQGRTAADELEELAVASALGDQLARSAALGMHRALLAGASPVQVAAARGVTIGQAAEQWRTWASGQRKRWLTTAPGRDTGSLPAQEYDTVAALWRDAERPWRRTPLA
jgi:hypothetical protein